LQEALEMGGMGGGGALEEVAEAAEEGTDVTVMVKGGLAAEVGGWFEGDGAPLCTWARSRG